jgi:hypothetical protein
MADHVGGGEDVCRASTRRDKSMCRSIVGWQHFNGMPQADISTTAQPKNLGPGCTKEHALSTGLIRIRKNCTIISRLGEWNLRSTMSRTMKELVEPLWRTWPERRSIVGQRLGWKGHPQRVDNRQHVNDFLHDGACNWRKIACSRKAHCDQAERNPANRTLQQDGA